MQDENAAQLLDVMTYWLNVEYAKWTTDPEEARAAANDSDRVQQPPFPIIEPVAHRPPAVHAAAVARYEALLTTWRGPRRARDAAEDAPNSARTMLAHFATPTNVQTFPRGGE